VLARRLGVILSPIAVALISLSLLWFRKDSSLTIWTSISKAEIIYANMLLGIAIACGCALFLRTQPRQRIDDMLGAGIYALIVDGLLVGFGDSLMR
jgi:hypothetical protein